MLAELFVLSIDLWHKKNVSSDLLCNIQQNLEITITEIWERFDDGCQVCQPDLLGCSGAVGGEDLVDHLEELWDFLSSFCLGICLSNHTHLFWLLLIAQFRLIIAKLMQSTVAQNE